MASQTQDLGGPLKAKLERRDGVSVVSLSGYINEATDLAPLGKLASPLLIDLSGIERINSVGVKTWVQFVRQCEKAGTELTCERCSPTVVQQLSMISNFMGSKATVKSLYIVYLCAACQSERLELVEITAGQLPSVAPTLPCNKCKATMQLDEIEQMYTKLFETK